MKNQKNYLVSGILWVSVAALAVANAVLCFANYKEAKNNEMQ